MDLSDRMKMYERVSAGVSLIPNLPIMIRLDGKAFHSWTRGMDRPYDIRLQSAFDDTTAFLVDQTNAVIGYTQSDEISLIIWNYAKVDSDTFFSGNVAKLNSVCASMATAFFNQAAANLWDDRKMAYFDCRVWNVPSLDEAVNCLVWREQDAVRNSILMAAQAYYSPKQMHKKKTPDLQDMLHEKGVNWNDYPARFKRGGYFRRELFEREFTDEELSRLPEQHEARTDPNLMVTRSRIVSMDMPILTKIVNRVGVIFHKEEPRLTAK